MPVLEPFGDAAWRVRLAPDVMDASGARALLDALRALPGAVDAVVCERHALVAFDPASPPSPAAIERAVETARSGRGSAASREHVVRVRYDGADLEEVARTAALSARDVAERHAAPVYVVAAIGFLPGFAYLRGLDARLVLPRRPTPRPRVPALSVGIAGPYTGVYPFESPGGWNLVGTAAGFTPFDPRAGAALALGDRVRFVPESA